MTSIDPLYLVPFDFTPEAEYALDLAYQLAEKNDRQVYMLHVAKNNSDRIVARKNFEERVAQLTPEQRVRTTSKVIVGDLFSDLAKAGDILNTSMIVMGTHGAKGFQKLFGSHAEKIISSTSVPVLILREKEDLASFSKIVMPFSFEKETIQILRYATNLAKECDSEIHLVGHQDSDSALRTHVKVNQRVARKFLTEQNVKHEIISLDKKKSFQKDVVAYADSIDAGLIAATYFREGILPTPNSFIQEMIENEAYIPLLTINAEEISIASGSLSFMTS